MQVSEHHAKICVISRRLLLKEIDFYSDSRCFIGIPASFSLREVSGSNRPAGRTPQGLTHPHKILHRNFSHAYRPLFEIFNKIWPPISKSVRGWPAGLVEVDHRSPKVLRWFLFVLSGDLTIFIPINREVTKPAWTRLFRGRKLPAILRNTRPVSGKSTISEAD